MSFGQGNITYNFQISLGANGAAIANNGLSIFAGTTIQLGAPDGAAAAAVLLNNREIPMAGFSLKFSGIGATATGVPTFKQDPTIAGNTPDLLFQQSDGQEAGRIRFLSNVGGDAGDIAMGRLAGAGVTTVDSRMWFGWRAGELATNAAAGAHAFGYEALRLVTGINNHAFGNQALHNITSGANNLGIGKNGALNADILNQCIFIGNFAGPAVWAGRACNNNTFIGFGCGVATGAVAFTAIQNTFLGSGAAQLAAGGYGDNNVLVGFNAANLGGFTTGCTIIGANTVPAGGLQNITILGQGISVGVQNVAVLCRNDQNAIIGATVANTDQGSRLQVLGGLGVNIRLSGIATTFNPTNDHTIVLSAAVVVTLPAAAAGNQNSICWVVNQAAATTFSINYTNFAGAPINTIAANSAIAVQSTGAAWIRIV